MRERSRAHAHRVAIALLAGALFVACSSGDSGDQTSAPTTTALDATATTAATVTTSATDPDGAVDDTTADTAASTGPAGDFEPAFAPTPVDYPDQPEGVAWPTEEWPEGDLPTGVDPTEVEAVLDRAFGELSPSDLQATDAVVVVQGGRIVAERYRPGFGNETTVHRSWSMAKSFTQALAGILVRDGRLDPYAPAPVPEWEDPDDPRQAITTEDLLRMASGLAWKEDYFAPDSDTVAMLGGVGEADMAHYAADKPLEVEPGTRVRYATGTSNIVAGIIGRIVGTGDDYEAFIDDELLTPLGIDLADTRLGWDGAGQLIGGSVFDLTARDFARFGLLYLRGGEWDGEQIVPETWVDDARTPTPPPAGTESYGAHWWTYDDCAGGFRAGGLNGQHIVICPEQDLVVVVLSNRVDGKDGQVRDDLVAAFAGATPD